MATAPSFDVLVIGSGASGLAAARVGRARRRPRRGRDEDDPAGEQLLEGAGRHPGLVRRRRLARAARRGRDALLARDGRPRGSSTCSPSEAPSAIHWLEELGCAFTRENGGYRLARCGGASRKRLLQVGDRTGHAITKALRESFEAGSGEVLAHHRLTELEPVAGGWRASFATPDGHDEVEADDRRARLRRSLLRRGRGARASSRRTIPTRPARRRGSRSTPAPRRATSTRSSTTRTAAPGPRRCRGTRSPRRRAPTARCCSTRRARSSPTRSGRATWSRRRSSTRSRPGAA